MRRLIARFVAGALTVVGLAFVGAMVPLAHAASGGCPTVGAKGICLSDKAHPATPPEAPGGGGTESAGTTGSGGEVCRDQGKVIPCSKDGFTWMSSATGGCYGAMLDAAPDSPMWEGHDPSEGSLGYCPLNGVSQVTFFVPNGAAPQIVDAAAVAQRMLARAPFEVGMCKWHRRTGPTPTSGSRTPARESRWVNAVATRPRTLTWRAPSAPFAGEQCLLSR